MEFIGGGCIFGICCLIWAIMLTVGCIKEKGNLFVKGKERLGYMVIVVLYMAGIILILLK